MKLKKIIVFLLVVLMIFSLTIPIFATSSSETIDGIKKEDLIPALEEKLKAKETEKNKESNSETSEKEVEKSEKKDDSEAEKEEKENSTVDKETENDENDENDREKIEEDIAFDDVQRIYENEILEDLVITGNESDIECKSTYIDGNIFIVTGVKVLLKDCKVNGDIFVLGENLELDSVEVDGSIYIAGATQIKINASMDSLYAFGENIEIEEYSQISKELRVICENFNFEGYVGRDAYIIATSSNILGEAEIEGDCTIQAEESNISDDARIDGKTDVTIVEMSNVGFNVSLESYLPEIATEFAIILIVAIFILGGFPKFTEVNSRLRLRDFVKSFFIGLLTIIVVMLIVLGLCIWGYGIGYAFALAILTGVLLALGKLIFIVAFAIRIIGKSENVSKIKIFFMAVFVAIVIEAISLIAILGTIGMFIAMVFNMVIGISGFGSLIKVILSSRKVKKSNNKLNKDKANKENKEVQEVIKEEMTGQEQLQAEIRKEVEEEIKELIEERKLENEIEQNNEERKDEEAKNEETNTDENIKNNEDDNNDENR